MTWLSAAMVPAGLLGGYLGIWAGKRIRKTTMYIIFAVFLALLGAYIIAGGLRLGLLRVMSSVQIPSSFRSGSRGVSSMPTKRGRYEGIEQAEAPILPTPSR